jgi:hypothetical protein
MHSSHGIWFPTENSPFGLISPRGSPDMIGPIVEVSRYIGQIFHYLVRNLGWMIRGSVDP